MTASHQTVLMTCGHPKFLYDLAFFFVLLSNNTRQNYCIEWVYFQGIGNYIRFNRICFTAVQVDIQVNTLTRENLQQLKLQVHQFMSTTNTVNLIRNVVTFKAHRI